MPEINIVVVHGFIAREVDSQLIEILGDGYNAEAEYMEGGWQTHICCDHEFDRVEVSATLAEMVEEAMYDNREILCADCGILDHPEVYEDEESGIRWRFLGNIRGYESDGIKRYGS